MKRLSILLVLLLAGGSVMASDMKKPLLSLGLFASGGYAMNTTYHASQEDLAKWGRLTENPQSSAKPSHFNGGGGASLRHYFTWWNPLSDFGLEVSGRWSLFENAQTGYLTKGDATLPNDVRISSHQSIDLETILLWRAFAGESVAFDFTFGFTYAIESFQATRTVSGVTVLNSDIKGTGIGGSLGFQLEFLLANYVNLFGRLQFDFVPVSDLQDNGFGRETITAAGQLVKIYTPATNAKDAPWDHHGVTLRVGAYFYAF